MGYLKDHGGGHVNKVLPVCLVMEIGVRLFLVCYLLMGLSNFGTRGETDSFAYPSLILEEKRNDHFFQFF